MKSLLFFALSISSINAFANPKCALVERDGWISVVTPQGALVEIDSCPMNPHTSTIQCTNEGVLELTLDKTMEIISGKYKALGKELNCFPHSGSFNK